MAEATQHHAERPDPGGARCGWSLLLAEEDIAIAQVRLRLHALAGLRVATAAALSKLFVQENLEHLILEARGRLY